MSERDGRYSWLSIFGVIGVTLILISLLGMVFLADSQIRDLQRRVAELEQRR